jgi:hypothetical protein
MAQLLPERGERTLSIGQTGSGKTSFNVWLLDRLPRAPTVVYDTKEEPKFLTLPDSTVTSSAAETTEALDSGEADYVIFRPPDHLLDEPSALDEYLYFHYKNFPGVDAYIDEVYSFHSGGRSFKGLHALLSRGRSKGISTLMSTQRPVFLSRFALTEAQHLYIFSLVHDDDRKTLNKMVPGFESKRLLKPRSHQFWHYDVANQKLRLYDPVTLTRGVDQGYTDDQLPGLEPDAEKVRRLIWV